MIEYDGSQYEITSRLSVHRLRFRQEDNGDVEVTACPGASQLLKPVGGIIPAKDLPGMVELFAYWADEAAKQQKQEE